MDIKSYIEQYEGRFLNELFSLIRIPSISASPQHKQDMLKCAERWKELLLEAGVDKAEIIPSQGNPLVYAEKHISADAPTVLIYAHYDVMPAEPMHLWKSQPFEPVIRDGHIWGRGADDDKGHERREGVLDGRQVFVVTDNFGDGHHGVFEFFAK